MAEIIKCVACDMTLEQLRAATTSQDPKWYSRSCCPSEGQATVCTRCRQSCSGSTKLLCCHCWKRTTVIEAPFNAQASLNVLNTIKKPQYNTHELQCQVLGVVYFEINQCDVSTGVRDIVSNTMQAQAKKMYKLQQRHLQLEERNRQLTQLNESLNKRYMQLIVANKTMEQRLEEKIFDRIATAFASRFATSENLDLIQEKVHALQVPLPTTALETRIHNLEQSSAIDFLNAQVSALTMEREDLKLSLDQALSNTNKKRKLR